MKTSPERTSVAKTDAELKTDILSELKYEPGVKVTDIGVLVKDGTVTLNGFATSYSEKWEAVRAAKRVAGVKAIADDIEVNLPNSFHRNDGDIAAAAANQLAWSTAIPADTVEVTVRKGWITLNGEVESWHLKSLAENVVKHLLGVKGVSNLITIEPKLTTKSELLTMEIETAIKAAFKRNALLDSNRIKVETTGSKVVLSGTVPNFTELEEAERIAWAAPGVFSVDNQLTVNWFSFAE